MNKSTITFSVLLAITTLIAAYALYHDNKLANMLAASNQMFAASNQMFAESDQMLAASNQMLAESNQMLAASNQMLAEANQMLAKTNQRVTQTTFTLTPSDTPSGTPLTYTIDPSPDLATLTRQVAHLTAELEQTHHDQTTRLQADIAVVRQNLIAQLNRTTTEPVQLHGDTDTIQLASDIVFDLGSTRLSSAGKTDLAQVIDLIVNYPGYLVSLEGHTDDIPILSSHRHIYPTNWELSASRAAAAASFLIAQDISPSRLRVVGHADTRPLTPNTTDQARAQNRRLEILFSPKPRLKPLPN